MIRIPKRPLCLLALAAVAVGAVPVRAADEASPTGAALGLSLVGTWELVSYKVEDEATGRLVDAMGTTPRGRVIFTRDGWVAFTLEGSDRKPPRSDSDRAALMRTLVAYIGRYRVEGDQWVTSVQTAWTPEWVGTEQRRTVRVEGDHADVTTPWREMPNWDEGKPSRSIIRFRRAS